MKYFVTSLMLNSRTNAFEAKFGTFSENFVKNKELFLNRLEVAFTLVSFTQYTSTFYYAINIFCFQKRNNLLEKRTSVK